MYKQTITQSLSPASRWRSFGHALRGLQQVFRTEPNSWLHSIATLLVFVSWLLWPCTRTETILLVMATALVWMAEFFNTSIEKLADLVKPEQDPAIGRIKDISAAAVLIVSGAALLTGLIIFIPKIF